MTAQELLRDYATALARLRRHRRMMRATRCESREDGVCWMAMLNGQIGAEEMCDSCLLRQVAYHFRGEATKEVGGLRRSIERWAKKQAATS